jgi:two-component system, chemotaxis family, chemotaxis protein CheY
MKILVVEDDFASRILLQKFLTPYGEVHVAINGVEAVAAYRTAENEGDPYKLICLDIMMPEMGGQEVLTTIRRIERDRGYNPGEGAKVIMTTALKDSQNVMTAFREQCDAYLVKPIDRRKLVEHLGELGLAA